MNQSTINYTEVYQWDRYGEDAEKFTNLVNSIEKPNLNDLDFLFSTFSDKDDFGIQEAVCSALDRSDDLDFSYSLGKHFENLFKFFQQEWSLLIIGRYVNGENMARLKMIAQIAEAQCAVGKLELYQFLSSSYFLEEYPEFTILVRKSSI